MPLIIAGIDEAGYGPLLGPLCIGMTAFRVEDWSPGDPAPDLWKVLSRAVCRKPADKKRRIAVEDSKKLKLPNDEAAVRHPLLHLERGVLAFLSTLPCDGDRPPPPATDLDLFTTVGAGFENHPWYQGQARPIPCAHTPPEIAIAANVLRRGLCARGVTPLAMSCRAVCETAFNAECDRAGTKAAATALGLADHIRFAWDQWSDTGCADANEAAAAGPRIVCDRQGGRISYRGLLSRIIPEAQVLELEETDRCSRYLLRGGGGAGEQQRAMTLIFMPEAERQHLPVALASMLAKFIRELMMARFNAYWCAQVPELKPTAGYFQDGRRWLSDIAAAGRLTTDLRTTLIRRA